nr:unnamed protein product [Digitaria exilis]
MTFEESLSTQTSCSSRSKRRSSPRPARRSSPRPARRCSPRPARPLQAGGSSPGRRGGGRQAATPQAGALPQEGALLRLACSLGRRLPRHLLAGSSLAS